MASAIRSVTQSARPSSSATAPRRVGSARSSRPARRWSAAAGPFVRRSAKPSSTSTSARTAGSLCSSSARLRYPTAASAAPWASERSAAWRSVETTNESACGATRRRCPAALSGGAPASSNRSAAARLLGVAFDHVERLVDGAADDGVEELKRILAPEEVKPNECRGSQTELACFDACKRGRVAQIGPVAEDRDRADEGKRLGRQASKA